MKQWTVRETRRILEKNGFKKVRSRGSHEMYSNGKETIALPVVQLKGVIVNRLIKQYNLV